jgi:protein arginine N-methyltransferase 1
MSPAYRLSDFGRMIADEGRTRAYAESLTRLVKPSSVVVDIGTGTGIFALLAARAGAHKVYAIEPGDVIEFGRRVASRNGLADRIEFIQAFSTDVRLPERADVIVSDIHGILPANERSLFSILDARDRFLKPGGALIPLKETLWAALVHAPVLHYENVGIWSDATFQVDMTEIAVSSANLWHKYRAVPADLVTSPACWATLTYEELQSTDVHGELTWQIHDRRRAHGICAWFDWEGAESVSFSNSPLSGERHLYGQAVFPWPTSLELCPGDEVRIRLRTDAVASKYIYSWETLVRAADGAVRADFRQSDFLGLPLSAERLRTQRSGS